MVSTERAFYSLRNVGCHSNGLHPKSVAFVYKQFCQAILKYGLELLYLNSKTIHQLNVRQNVLIKNVLGLSYYARSKPLMNELGVEQVMQAYQKHKIFGFKQFSENPFTSDILVFLRTVYYFSEIP